MLLGPADFVRLRYDSYFRQCRLIDLYDVL